MKTSFTFFPDLALVSINGMLFSYTFTNFNTLRYTKSTTTIQTKKNPRKPNHPTSCLDINQTSCHRHPRNPDGVLASTHCTYLTCNISNFKTHDYTYIGSRPSDHYFRSVFVCLFVCAEFFSAVFNPIWIKLGHMLHVRV